jgi:hypothetical protein
MNKIYILQKDTLRAFSLQDHVLPAGTEVEFIPQFQRYASKSKWTFSKDFVENNPDWFKLKEDAVVLLIGDGPYKSVMEKYPFKYDLFSTHEFKDTSKERIVDAIQNILNDKPQTVFLNLDLRNAPKMYTEQEVLEREEKAFTKGRETESYTWIYSNFSEYKNSEK